MSKASRFPGFQPIRRDRLIQEKVHDAYKSRGKLPEPTVCPDCGALFHEGRWRWNSAPAGAHRERCPACHRIKDEYPAGFVTLAGPFLSAHRDEILGLVHHLESRERAEHPLERLMKIEDEDGGLLITTTSIHLARGIGDALHHAYQGQLEFHYNDADNLLRAHWER